MLIRRSNVIVPLGDPGQVHDAWRHDADAVTLDPEGVRDVRECMAAAIASARRGAAEVFVRVGAAHLRDGVAAAVVPGLSGVVLADVDTDGQVREAAALADALERERGLAAGALAFIVLLATPRAVWDMRAIVRASPRVSQAGLDEPALARALGIECVREIDPFVYARGRLAVECTAAGVGAIGMAWPLSVFDADAVAQGELHAVALRAKNLGMKGVVCPHPQWVAPVNAAFTPTPALVAWNRRVREAFAAGVAAGTAAVPLDGKMIDVPVDEWAKVVVEMAEACAARDAAKAAAREGARGR